MKHRIIAVICALTLALTFGVFTGCQNGASGSGSVGYQLEMPEKGEEIAIMHTSMGGILKLGFLRCRAQSGGEF